MIDKYTKFKQECQAEIERMKEDKDLFEHSLKWMNNANKNKYSYHFEWMGRPIIQYPQDIIAMQEIIWEVKPDIIIETGIAHGGSIIFYASMLELLSISGYKADSYVLGIDIDIREHNKWAIESHPMYKKIKMIEGSSIDDKVINRVNEHTKGKNSILVILDSNHTHEHVLSELQAYAPLVTKGSYCVVFDTIIDDFPEETYPDRPWGKNDNPKTAVYKYLENNADFIIDKSIHNKLMISVAPDGYLKRV